MHECLSVCQASLYRHMYMYLPMSITAAPFLTICPFIRPGMPEGGREGGRVCRKKEKREKLYTYCTSRPPPKKPPAQTPPPSPLLFSFLFLLLYLPLPILVFPPPHPPHPPLTSSHYHYVCHLCHHRQLLRGRVPVTMETKQPSSAYMHECVYVHIQCHKHTIPDATTLE